MIHVELNLRQFSTYTKASRKEWSEKAHNVWIRHYWEPMSSHILISEYFSLKHKLVPEECEWGNISLLTPNQGQNKRV
jgi:hypothetical protein